MNSENSKQTATPWVSYEGENFAEFDKIIITTDDRLYNSKVPIAEISINYSEPMEAEQKANAEFILRAVNSHDDMLAALKAVETYAPDIGVDQFRDALKSARAAISRAEGKS
jgi:hypothetical protein